MSAPAFVPQRGEIWYADGNSGFYNIHVTNGVWPFTTAAASKPATVQAAKATAPATTGNAPPAAVNAQLATTGGSVPVGWAGAAIAGGLALLGLRRRLAAR